MKLHNIYIYIYIYIYIVSSNNIIPKLRSLTQGHKTSRHKDVKYATKTSSYAMKTSVMPQGQQLCHEDINYATKTGYQDTNVTKTTSSG